MGESWTMIVHFHTIDYKWGSIPMQNDLYNCGSREFRLNRIGSQMISGIMTSMIADYTNVHACSLANLVYNRIRIMNPITPFCSFIY